MLHRQRAAQAAFDQAAAQYRSTVLTAFQNVADALHAIQSDADAVKAAVAAEKAAAQSLDIARRQLELGDISYLALLNAEQTYQQASVNLAQALSNRYADTAALFQAWAAAGGTVPTCRRECGRLIHAQPVPVKAELQLCSASSIEEK